MNIIEKAAATYPSEEQQALTYFKGEAFRGKKDCKKAQELFDAVLASTEKNIYTGASHIAKGLCLMEEGQYDPAVAAFARPLEENAEDHTIIMRARFETARAFEAQKKNEEALRFYLLVTTLYDDEQYCPEALLRAGGIFEQMGKPQEATNTFKEILNRYPDSPLLEAALKRIKSLSEIQN